MVKPFFKSNGTYIGAFVFGVFPIVAIVFSETILVWLALPMLINSFFWFFALLEAYKSFLTDSIINSNILSWSVVIIIAFANFAIGSVLGWVLEILFTKKEIEEREVWEGA